MLGIKIGELITIVFGILLCIYINRNQRKIYLTVVSTSIATGSFILTGKYPAVDEILNVFISISCVYLVFVLKKENQLIISINKIKLETFILLFLIVNTSISFLNSSNLSSLRFLLIFSTVLILVITVEVVKQDYSDIAKISFYLYSTYLLAWVGIWLVLAIFRIDWGSEQSILWAGSSYAALVPSIGIILMSISITNRKNNNLFKIFLVNYFFALTASRLYDSRILMFACILATLLLIKINFTVRNLLIILSTLILALSSSNLLASSLIEGRITKVSNTYKSLTDQLISTIKGGALLVSAQSSDSDRKFQVDCANDLIFNRSDPFNSLFGYGQNNHKTQMLRCFSIDKTSLTNISGIRPVGYAAFVIDFGITGLCLIFLLLVKRFKSNNDANARLFSLLLIFMLSWVFYSNILDNYFIYLCLFLDYFSKFTKDKINK